MPNLIQLEEEFLAHNLQCAYFSRILLLGEENLSVTTLADLSKNLEVSLTKTNTTLSQVGTLSPNILLPKWVICFFGCRRGVGVFGFEVRKAGLTVADVGEEIEIVIKEVCLTISNSKTDTLRETSYITV